MANTGKGPLQQLCRRLDKASAGGFTSTIQVRLDGTQQKALRELLRDAETHWQAASTYHRDYVRLQRIRLAVQGGQISEREALQKLGIAKTEGEKSINQRRASQALHLYSRLCNSHPCEAGMIVLDHDGRTPSPGRGDLELRAVAGALASGGAAAAEVDDLALRTLRHPALPMGRREACQLLADWYGVSYGTLRKWLSEARAPLRQAMQASKSGPTDVERDRLATTLPPA